MAGFRDSSDEEDTLYDDVSRMADRMFGKDADPGKRAKYIDDHMLQAGYERVQSRESYAKVVQEEEEEASGGGGWFSGGRRSESARPTRPNRDHDDDRF